MKKLLAALLALMLAMGSVSALAAAEPFDQEDASASRDVIFRVTTGYTWVLPDPGAFETTAQELFIDEQDLGKLEVKDLSLWPGQTLNFYLSSKNDFKFISEKDTDKFIKYQMYIGEEGSRNEVIVKENGPQPVVFGTKILDKNGYLLLKAAPKEDESFWKEAYKYVDGYDAETENYEEKTYQNYEGDDEKYRIVPDVYVDKDHIYSEHMYIQFVKEGSQLPTNLGEANFTEMVTIYAITQDLPDDDQLKEISGN